jgi:hypothetical protein
MSRTKYRDIVKGRKMEDILWTTCLWERTWLCNWRTKKNVTYYIFFNDAFRICLIFRSSMSNVQQQQLYINKYADQKTLISFSKSMTSIEDLSNEFFYEIFEYFYDCDMYKTFSNLNNHFQHLLTSSSQLLKINRTRDVFNCQIAFEFDFCA